jgi:hypothetical protein
MRQGDWKLLASLGSLDPRRLDIDEQSEREVKTAELQKFMLYNLQQDIRETNDLSATEPAKRAELRALLEPKYREVRAETPVWPHWKFVYLESQLIEWPDYWKKKQATKKR